MSGAQITANDIAREVPCSRLRVSDLEVVPLSVFDHGLGPDPIGSSLVYFIGCGDGNPFVKIGQTRDLHKRVAALRGANPLEITVLLVMRGSTTEERLLHAAFSEYRERGEWFRNEGELAELLEKSRK